MNIFSNFVVTHMIQIEDRVVFFFNIMIYLSNSEKEIDHKKMIALTLKTSRTS